MGDLESFSFIDQGPQAALSAEQVKEYQAKMAAAAKQLQAQQKKEKKQRKNEDELAKILLHFIQHSDDKELIELLSFLLSKNTPVSLLLTILLIIKPQLADPLGIVLQSVDNPISEFSLPLLQIISEKTLANGQSSEKYSKELNFWFYLIGLQFQENQLKIKANLIDKSDRFISPLVDFTKLCLNNYLVLQEIYMPEQAISDFCRLYLESLWKIQDRGQLSEAVD